MADANLLTPQRRLNPRLAAARDAFLRELDSTTLAEWSYPRNATAHAGFDHHVRSRTLDTPATRQKMKPLEFEGGAIQVDATIVANGLGIEPTLLLERLREGKITSLCERGIDADNGRYRLTFFSENRRFSLTVDENGIIIQRSTIDFGQLPLPASAHKPG